MRFVIMLPAFEAHIPDAGCPGQSAPRRVAPLRTGAETSGATRLGFPAPKQPKTLTIGSRQESVA